MTKNPFHSNGKEDTHQVGQLVGVEAGSRHTDRRRHVEVEVGQLQKAIADDVKSRERSLV